jgi:hypothetical protein
MSNGMMRLRSLLFASLLCLGCYGYAQPPGAGYCVGFNGVDQILLGNNHPGYALDASVTLEAWVKPICPNPTAYYHNGIFNLQSYDPVLGWRGYSISTSGTASNMHFNMDAPGSGYAYLNAIRANEWQHIAVAADALNYYFYVNGELIWSTNRTPIGQPSPAPIQIGSNPFGFFSGELDELRIWNRTLSQADLQNWMCKKVTSSHPAYSDLVGYWRLDEGSGAMTADLSPSANNLSHQNGPMWGWSSAPVGDRSVWQYGSINNLRLGGPAGDTLRITGVNGSMDGLHLYAVDAAPNFPPAVFGYSGYDSTHHYGIFPVDGGSATLNLRYEVGSNPYYANASACQFGLVVRNAANVPTWNNASGSLDLPGRAVVLTNFPGLIQLQGGLRPSPWSILAIPNDSACLGDIIQIATSSGAVSYQWLLGGNPIPGATITSYQATQPGTYSLNTVGGGCSYTATLPLTFLAAPTPNFSVPAGLCADAGNLNLSATPGGGAFSGPGVAGSTFDPLLAGTGSHSITYTYTDSLGCIGMATGSVAVHPAPFAQLAPFPDHCQGDGVALLSGGQPGGGTYFGPGVTGTVLDPFAAGLGQIPVGYLYVDGNGCDDTAFANLQVLPSPPTPTISVAGGTLYSSSPTGNQWYDSSGPIPGANGQTYTPPVSGTFYVIVTAPNGCASDTSLTYALVGLRAANSLQLMAWPNPARGSTQIAWPSSPGDCMLELYQLDGKCLLRRSSPATGGGTDLDLSALPSGSYLLRVVHPLGAGVLRLTRID